MNIPQSALEPFGVIGIPCVQFDDRKMGKSIKIALQHYRDKFYDNFYGIQHIGSGVQIIQNDLSTIARINGAINVTCDPAIYPSQVVFAVKYQLPYSKKKCHVGVGIKITPIYQR